MADGKPSKTRMGTRAKKFVSSKTAGTKLGRKAILNIIGEDGEALFDAIKRSAKKHFGDKQGKKLKENILKLIMKINIMINDNVLTPENTTSGQEPMHRLLFQVQQDFEHLDAHTDVQDLSQEMVSFGKVWVDIVRSKMKDKNVSKLKSAISMLSDVDYLEKLFNADDYSEFREMMAGALSHLMLTIGMFDVNESATCQIPSCSRKATRSRGIFRSSGMCEMHHEDCFHSMILEPNLDDFMSLSCSAVVLVDFLTRYEMANYFHFLKSVSEFKSISSPQIRLRSLKVIQKKYLQSTSSQKIETSEEAWQETLNKLDDLDEDELKIPTRLFQAIEMDVHQRLSTLFDTEFTKSKEFERFCMSYRLPPNFQEAARRQRGSSLETH